MHNVKSTMIIETSVFFIYARLSYRNVAAFGGTKQAVALRLLQLALFCQCCWLVKLQHQQFGL